MAEANVQVFNCINDAVKKALKEQFGPPTGHRTAQIGAALMQLSLRYFAEIATPKGVVQDLFKHLMDEPLPAKEKQSLIHVVSNGGKIT